MPLQSMTGFGKAEITWKESQYQIELRSLNSKQLDLNCRLPYRFRSREMEVRARIADQLVRGKIDLFIQKKSGITEGTAIDTDLVRKYMNDLQPLLGEMGITADSGIISSVLRMPDVIRHGEEEPSEEEWSAIAQGIDTAIAQLNAFRTSEGEGLEKDLTIHLSTIASLSKEVVAAGGERIPIIRQRLEQAVNEWSQQPENDKNRLEQELAFYIEKIDFSEEIQRLSQHCTYFLQTIKEVNAGRKLSFIAQEMGREINTLGSKAYHAGIQRKVVDMKDALEKIKEQLLNVL